MAINYGKPLPMLPKREGQQNGRTIDKLTPAMKRLLAREVEKALAPPGPIEQALSEIPVKAKTGRPASGKKVVSIRLDPAVIDKFKDFYGRGWQAHMNDVLKAAKL